MHFHPCVDCKQETECPGEWESNFDGFPEVICSVVLSPSCPCSTRLKGHATGGGNVWERVK